MDANPDVLLDEKIDILLEGTPKGVSAIVLEKIAFLKTKRPLFSNVELYLAAEELARLARLAYMDSRTYLELYNRNYSEYKLSGAINRLMRTSQGETPSDVEFFSIARINFDFNGLQALNGLAGRESGSRGLKMFSDMLRAGTTTQWLEQQGLEVTASGEGADQFGIVIAGDMDLRPITNEIVNRYFEETRELQAGPLINFTHPLVLEKLETMGLDSKVPKDFRFELTTSVGISLFGEAVTHIAKEALSESYETILKRIMNKMFSMADTRALAHNTALKDELISKNPLLGALYSRMSQDVMRLEEEITRRDNRIEELEDALKKKQ